MERAGPETGVDPVSAAPARSGVPSENPMLDEPGLVIRDFVDRVGDPDGIVAADGTTHRSETLVADASAGTVLRRDRRTGAAGSGRGHPPCALGGRRRSTRCAVALRRVAEWSRAAVDAAIGRRGSAISRCSPTRGCRTAESSWCATSAAPEPARPARRRPTATAGRPAVRHREFSGDLIDQALLTHVVAELSSAGSFDTSAPRRSVR